MIITVDQVLTFFMIFSRFSGIVVSAPFFNNRQLFSAGKVALMFWASALWIFLVPLPVKSPDSMATFMLSLILEFLIGVMIGFVADIIISAIELAGALIDTQAGLSVASMLDPTTGRNAALFELFLKWVATMIFVLMDGHHMILTALHKSFTMIPIGSPLHFSQGAYFILQFGQHLFKAAIQLAAPIILVVFLVDFAFGMLNRVAEQINVFQLGFQIKPTVSVVVFLAMTPTLAAAIQKMMESMMENMILLMTNLQGVV